MENIESIRFEGFYTEGGEKLNPHTEKSKQIFEKGLQQCGELNVDEYFAGIIFVDGKKVLEIETNEGVRYQDWNNDTQ
jgi:23S rRNA maturation-related 3'-5' exoribonuclease YhaM